MCYRHVSNQDKVSCGLFSDCFTRCLVTRTHSLLLDLYICCIKLFQPSINQNVVFTQVRELEGMPLLLDHCNVDDHNPCILFYRLTHSINIHILTTFLHIFLMPVLVGRFCWNIKICNFGGHFLLSCDLFVDRLIMLKIKNRVYLYQLHYCLLFSWALRTQKWTIKVTFPQNLKLSSSHSLGNFENKASQNQVPWITILKNLWKTQRTSWRSQLSKRLPPEVCCLRQTVEMTMFTMYSPLSVFRFSVKLSSFALASKARIVLHYSHLCSISLTAVYNF